MHVLNATQGLPLPVAIALNQIAIFAASPPSAPRHLTPWTAVQPRSSAGRAPPGCSALQPRPSWPAAAAGAAALVVEGGVAVTGRPGEEAEGAGGAAEETLSQEEAGVEGGEEVEAGEAEAGLAARRHPLQASTV